MGKHSCSVSYDPAGSRHSPQFVPSALSLSGTDHTSRSLDKAPHSAGIAREGTNESVTRQGAGSHSARPGKLDAAAAVAAEVPALGQRTRA